MDAITGQLIAHGVPLVGLNVLLQQLGLPIPAVPTMMIAGALAAAGRLDFAQAFAISVAASVIADLAWFWAGRRYGYPVLRGLCRISLSPDTCVRQTEGIFERWGFFSVVVSKFIPGFSTVAPPIAGALRMRTGAFIVASTGSAVLWVGAAMVVGAAFARQIDAALAWMERHVAAAALVLGALFAAYIAVKVLQRFRMARFLAGAMISVDELREALAGESPPMVIDIGSRALAGRARTHSGRVAARPRRSRDARRFPRRPGHRALLRMPERSVVASRRPAADPQGPAARATAAGRTRRMDRDRQSGRVQRMKRLLAYRFSPESCFRRRSQNRTAAAAI